MRDRAQVCTLQSRAASVCRRTGVVRLHPVSERSPLDGGSQSITELRVEGDRTCGEQFSIRFRLSVACTICMSAQT